MLYFNKNSVLQFTDWGGEWYLLQIAKICPVESLFQMSELTVCLQRYTMSTIASAWPLEGVLHAWMVHFISKVENTFF